MLLVALVEKERGRGVGAHEVPYSLRNPKVDQGWSFPGPKRALLQPMGSGKPAPLSIHALLLGRALHANPNIHVTSLGEFLSFGKCCSVKHTLPCF